MIELSEIRFAYPADSFDLHIPHLSIPSGQAVAVTGRSGCGKTTLLNLLAGILLPSQGTLNIDEICVSQLTDAQRREFRLQKIGLVFQDFQLIDYLSVLDNVLLPCRISSTIVLNSKHRDRAAELLKRVGLSLHVTKSVTRLSQGERQRVAICRALLLNPVLLLADEPTGNLDPRLSNEILQLLLSQARETGATIVTVTHDHSLLPAFDRVIPFETFRTSDHGKAAK